jgi:glycerophosphoryl diester phosphodiesterase
MPLPQLVLAAMVTVIAHRGEHLRNPENTLPAFREAIALEADYIEMDVRTSSDGILVLSHDSNVDRRTNGHGEVSKLTFDELRKLDAGGGAKIPTFDEALELAQGRIGIYVDAKQVSASALVTAIASRRMDANVVIYGSPRLLKEIQTLNPALKGMPEANNAETARRLIGELHPRVFAFNARDFQADVIKIVLDAGAEIFVDRLGAADTPAHWQDAIDRGARGIQTDHPGELVDYLRTKGYRSPTLFPVQP